MASPQTFYGEALQGDWLIGHPLHKVPRKNSKDGKANVSLRFNAAIIIATFAFLPAFTYFILLFKAAVGILQTSVKFSRQCYLLVLNVNILEVRAITVNHV